MPPDSLERPHLPLSVGRLSALAATERLMDSDVAPQVPVHEKERSAGKAPDVIHWVSYSALIAGLPLKQELYASVVVVAEVYLGWRPAETQWKSVRLGAMDQQNLLIADQNRHLARKRPQEANALFGEILNYPVHAALIEVATMGKNPCWSRLLALFAWPHIAPKALGHDVSEPAAHHVRRFGQFLRECAVGKVPEPLLNRVWDAWAQLDGREPRLLPGIDRATWIAIQAHVDAYRSTIAFRALQDAEHDRQVPVSGNLPFELLIDEPLMADPANEGLAPEDAGALSYAVSDEPSDGHSDSDSTGRLFRNIFEGERHFQHLPLAWTRISPTEIRALRSALPEDMTEGQLGMAISICLSIPPESVPHLQLHRSFAEAVQAAIDGSWHLAMTQSKAIVAVHSVLVPQHAFRRTKDITGLLPSSSYCFVGLPSPASSMIHLACHGEPGHLLRFFPDIARSARASAESLRKKTGARLTFGRLQEVVADELFRVTQDECLVARALPTSRILVGSGIYYSSYMALRLFWEHARAIETVLGWRVLPLPMEAREATRYAYVGSELVINRRSLQGAIRSLIARTETLIPLKRYTPERLVAAFNAIGMYTLAVLSLTTGHRTTNEPFPDPSDISSDCILICDKRQFGSNEQRVVPLSNVARAQMDAYLKSVGAAAAYLDRDAPLLAAQLRSLGATDSGSPSCALFSVMHYDSGTFSLRPFERSDWKRFWPEWPWPENGNRHFLTQFLNVERMSRELISYTLGHAEPGQTAFNRQSSISPQQYFDAIAPTFAKLERDLGLKVCGPLKGYGKAGTKAPAIMMDTPLFGDSSPYRNRKRPLRLSEKALVRRLLRDFRGETYKLKQYVESHCSGDALLARRVLRLISRCDQSYGK